MSASPGDADDHPRRINGVSPRALGLYVGFGLAAVAAAALIPTSAYATNVLMQASTYALAVLGLVVVLGYTGQLSLAQAAFFGLGAYGVALGTTSFALPFWAALVVGVGIAGVAGAALGLTTLRLGGHYLAMVTISFQTMVTLLLTNWIGLTRGPDGVTGIGRPDLLKEGPLYLSACVAILFVVAFLVWHLKSTRLGRAMQAVRDNELAASVAGVNTYRTKVAAFTLSALLGSFGGALFAGGFSYVSPDQFSFSESVVFLTMALLGGAASSAGAVLGTALLTELPEWLRFLKAIYLAVYGGAVILIMIFMPDGIFGTAAAWWRKMWPPTIPSLDTDKPADAAARWVDEGATPNEPLILVVKQLSKHFGGLKAVDLVDLAVRRNTVHALIGPNGSGKTTLLNVLSGVLRPSGGAILFNGHNVTTKPPYSRAALGLGRTFQNIRLFTRLTVLENVLVSAERRGNRVGSTATARERHALAALAFVGLGDRAMAAPGSLSYGHQRMVEIARALAGRPMLLLLDEPGAGLNHVEKDGLVALLKRLKGHGLTIFIIDHDMAMVEQVADHITVLNFGKRIADGAPVDVLRHPDVVAAYLGEEHPARHHVAS
jgi:branched-chain amino acid transport system permease protein